MPFKYIYSIAFLIVLVQSCTERVDIDLEEAGEPRLVVFAEITNEVKAHEVWLGKSAPYFSNQSPAMVSGAVLTIENDFQTIQLTEDRDRQGIYLTPKDYRGVVGAHYKLTVSGVDVNGDGQLETYEAETEMKASAPVQGVAVAYNASWEGWEVGLYSKDPAETEDYYLFKVYKNGVLYTDSIHNYWTADDRFFNGNEINGPVVQYFDEENGEFVEQGDTIMLEMAGITKEYYDYIAAVDLETGEKIPLFSGPSANPKGNISNGGLGFFAVMEVQRGQAIYNGAEVEN
jgi:hypothetical protein